jgi:hypothetical protein
MLAVNYRREAAALLRDAMAAEDPAQSARYVAEAAAWHSRAVAAEERHFAGLDDDPVITIPSSPVVDSQTSASRHLE